MATSRPYQKALKKRWLRENPPDENGYYTCWICKHPVHISVVTIDHVFPVEQYPEYAKDIRNLDPAHLWCNQNRAAPHVVKRYGSTMKRARRKRY